METVTHQQIYDRLVAVEGKVDEIDKKLAVSINSTENNIRQMEKIEMQLSRIEDKIDRVKR